MDAVVNDQGQSDATSLPSAVALVGPLLQKVIARAIRPAQESTRVEVHSGQCWRAVADNLDGFIDEPQSRAPREADARCKITDGVSIHSLTSRKGIRAVLQRGQVGVMDNEQVRVGTGRPRRQQLR